MSKDLSRRDFLKGAAAGIAGVAAMGVLGACENKESTPSAAPENKGLYTPGTYSATATGMAENMHPLPREQVITSTMIKSSTAFVTRRE